MGLLPAKLLGRLLAKAKRVIAVLWEDEDVFVGSRGPWTRTENAARFLHTLLHETFLDIANSRIGAAIDDDDRRTVERALRMLDCFARDRLISEFVLEGGEPDAGYYETVVRLQRAARDATRFVDVHAPVAPAKIVGWYHLGEMIAQALNLVRQRLANSEGGGAVANSVVGRVVDQWSANWANYQSDQDDVRARLIRREEQARYDDALDGWAGTEELRQAFRAAWTIGHYEFAVALARRCAADARAPRTAAARP